MQSIHPQAVIQSSDPIDFEHLQEVLYEEFPTVTALSPTSSAFGLAHNPDLEGQDLIVIMIEAVDPLTLPDVTTLNEKIITDLPLTLLAENHTSVFIGSSLAEDLGATVGDTIDLLYASDQQPHNKKLVFNATEVTVAGIIKTGYEDLDGRLVLCSYGLFNRLFPDVGILEKYSSTLHRPPIFLPQSRHSVRASALRCIPGKICIPQCLQR